MFYLQTTSRIESKMESDITVRKDCSVKRNKQSNDLNTFKEDIDRNAFLLDTQLIELVHDVQKRPDEAQ